MSENEQQQQQQPAFGISFKSRDEALERLCLKVFGATPVFETDLPAERPTPITKHLLRNHAADLTESQVNEIIVAHEDLERQLAESRKTVAMYQESKSALPEYSSQRELRRQLAERTEERDALLKTLSDLRHFPHVPSASDLIDSALTKGASNG